MISHNPEITPTDPELFQLRMGRRQDGKILALIYLEYQGLPPGIPSADVARVNSIIGDNTGPTQHVLDTEVCKDIHEAQAWFEKTRKEQPWIKRN